MTTKGLFIAGTDTGVGKSVVASGLASAFSLLGYRVCVMKPVACGSWGDSKMLQRASGCRAPLSMVTPIFFKRPLAPTVAARIENKPIRYKRIGAAYNRIVKMYQPDIVLVEGCGGLLVPLGERNYVADIPNDLGLETILVSRSGLGAINHALLSAEAARARGLLLKGIIYNRRNGGALSVPEKTNPLEIQKKSGVPSLGLFPWVSGELTPAKLATRTLKHIDLKKTVC